MKIFDFGKNVLDQVVKEIENSDKFVYIALFQIHSPLIFTILEDKLKLGTEVKILTLPYDSINDDVKNEVTQRFVDLQKKGAKVYFCKWNVGDPERTTTAVARWYSFHGKFLVTDKCAIALSANFTMNPEMDAVIIFKNERNRIIEFTEKFDELLQLFVNKTNGTDGIIKKKILNLNIPNIMNIFELPKIIQTDLHKDHWIMHYPSELCPDNVPINDQLYLVPFDCRGRNFLQSIISNASKYAYVSSESFTDPGFSSFMIRNKFRGIDIKVLTGGKSQDFQARVGLIMRDLLSQGIEVRTIGEDLHAKMIVTDKHLVISSINLNNMNLGFSKTKKYWRENTETITVCSDPQIINDATHKYLDIFSKATSVENMLAKSLENEIKAVLTKTFSLRTRPLVRSLLAKFIVKREIEAKKTLMEICRNAAKLMKILNKSIVDKEDLFLALILFYLTERKHDKNDLDEKLKILDTDFNLENLMSILIKNNLVELSDDYYKIKLTSLLGNA